MTISSGPVPAAPRGLPHTPDADWHDAPGHWSEHTPGTTALAIASLGFAAYGLYCLVDAYARHP